MANEKRRRQIHTRKNEGIPIRHRMENQSRLSVIISVQQDEKTIRKVLRQVERLSPKEILMIIHGSRDRSTEMVLNYATYAHTSYMYPFPLGDELWRSIGAKEATGDVWLFLNGSTVILAEDMQPFVSSCYEGIDIALRKPDQESVSGTVDLAKTYLNSLFDQEQLGLSSMSDLPCAITREAASHIGVDQLFMPPLAQAIALEKGLRVVPVHQIKILGQGSPMRRIRVKDLTCLGDHLEAVAYWSNRAKGVT